MTKKEAIETIESAKHFAYDDIYEEAFNIAIEALKQESKWTPVSERLPKPYEQVLRTVKSIGWNSTFHIHVDIGTICPADKEVIAWMPLPKPYKEGE